MIVDTDVFTWYSKGYQQAVEGWVMVGLSRSWVMMIVSPNSFGSHALPQLFSMPTVAVGSSGFVAGISPIPAQSPIDVLIQNGTGTAETHHSKNWPRKVGFRCSVVIRELKK